MFNGGKVGTFSGVHQHRRATVTAAIGIQAMFQQQGHGLRMAFYRSNAQGTPTRRIAHLGIGAFFKQAFNASNMVSFSSKHQRSPTLAIFCLYVCALGQQGIQYLILLLTSGIHECCDAIAIFAIGTRAAVQQGLHGRQIASGGSRHQVGHFFPSLGRHDAQQSA